MKKTIPLCIPYLDQREKNILLEILESGWLTHGPYNKKLEEQFCKLLGVKHAVCVNSCTSALELAIKATRITGEVIVPSFTWVASANAIVTGGATPVFCDSDIKTRNVTSEYLESVLTRKTEAVMVVHYGGQCCPMDSIYNFCKKNNLYLIEDSAETIGGTWNGRQAGSWGIGCFSFFPTKNITTGEGGLFSCNDDQLFDVVKPMMAHGISTSTLEREGNSVNPWEKIATLPGHNFRMSNLLAGLGVCQMQKLAQMNELRRTRANYYNEHFINLDLPLEVPYEALEAEHVYQMYTLTVEPEVRNALVYFLKDKGIGATVHFAPPLHQHPYYKNQFPTKIPLHNAEFLAKSLISLPMYPSLKFSEIDYIIEQVQAFFALN